MRSRQLVQPRGLQEALQHPNLRAGWVPRAVAGSCSGGARARGAQRTARSPSSRVSASVMERPGTAAAAPASPGRSSRSHRPPSRAQPTDGEKVVFEMKGVSPALANAFRRILLAEASRCAARPAPALPCREPPSANTHARTVHAAEKLTSALSLSRFRRWRLRRCT